MGWAAKQVAVATLAGEVVEAAVMLAVDVEVVCPGGQRLIPRYLGA